MSAVATAIAAPIKWESDLGGQAHDGDTKGQYQLFFRGGRWSIRFRREPITTERITELEAAQKFCQDHKQNRLEELLAEANRLMGL